MTTRYLKPFLLLVSMIFMFPAFAEKESVVIGNKFVLTSEYLGEDRPYFVSVPDSYNDETYYPRNYPVLYVLDGEAHFRSTSGIVGYMSASSQVPEMIVVAIPNTTDRYRDLTPTHTLIDFNGKESKMQATTGGGDNFLQFIEKELIPEIESNYRVKPYRTFVGHSLGGLTVLHSLLSQPGLFNSYIAIDSSLWWDENWLTKRVQEFVDGEGDQKQRVFMSLAEHKAMGRFDGVSTMIFTNMSFSEQLRESTSPDFKVKLQTFPGEDHGSVPILSLYNGLLHAFDGYKISMEDAITGHTVIADHFKRFSDSVGVEFLPPEQAVDTIAQYAAMGLFELKPDAVQGYLKMNVTNYPDSESAKKKLAEFQLGK